MYGNFSASIERDRLLLDLDRYLTVLDRLGPQPSIGAPDGRHNGMPNIFFVDSGTGSASNDGRRTDRAFTTLEAGVGACTANNGDMVILMPGHSETLTASLSLAKAGVKVIGMGHGAARPTFVVGDAVGEAITLDAASLWLENLIFICGTDAQTNMVRILAADCTVKDCDFREVVTTKQPLTMLDITGASANDCDRSRVIGCGFYGPTAGDGDRAIELGEVADRIEIRNCVAIGNWDDACIHNPTGKVLTNLTIRDCELTNNLTGQHSIELVSACTGILAYNLYHNDMTQATGSDPGSCANFENYHDDTVDVSGILSPAAT